MGKSNKRRSTRQRHRKFNYARDRSKLKSPRVAVLLNRNARKVNAQMINRIRLQVPSADIFVTESLAEAEKALQTVARGQYDICFTGGGDGTVCHAVTRLNELSEHFHAPPIGVLPLGTGNAIASFLESPSVEDCVRESSSAIKEQLSFPRMRVINEDQEESIQSRQAAFGGFGWDAFVLDRYFKWRDLCKKSTMLKPVGEGLLAYLISGIGWAVPEMLLTRPRWDIVVRNGPSEAVQTNQNGEVLKTFAPGEVLYEGSARLFSFGTCPFFGFRLKALPLAAATSDMMQIRIADFSPLITTLYLPKIWKGDFTHRRLWDFLASEFEVTLSEKAALQMGGDVIGHARQFKVDMSTPADVLRFGEYKGIKLSQGIHQSA